MDGKKHRASYEYHIPHDIIESILTRLPAKSLFRFKSVCKQWSATISDPEFAETHLQRSNTSSSFIIPCAKLRRFRRIRVQNDEFQELSTIENQPPLGRVLCHCDGLFLILHRRRRRKGYKLYLWNPSRRTYKEVCFPYQNVIHCFKKSGICYDPLVRDYKVVIGDDEHYAVYYCKTNSWSQLKEMNIVKMNGYRVRGVHFKGSIYWISNSETLSLSKHNQYKFELICFDGRDEKMTNFDIVDCTTCCAELIPSRDCLYLFPVSFADRRRPLMKKTAKILMKKDGEDPCIELKLKLKLQTSCHCVKPLCSTQDNKIILYGFDYDHDQTRHEYLLYDDTKGGATQILNTVSLTCFYLFPYLENILSSSL